MAITVTPVTGRISQGNMRTWLVKADADGDTTATITHGMTFAAPTDAAERCKVTLLPIHADHTKQEWIFESLTASELKVKKTLTAAGSGVAADTIRVTLEYIASPWA